jgi:hypothetical protein
MTDGPASGKLPYVKIFGERNTGTNYLETLIGLNFVAQQLRGAHGKLILFMNSLGKHSPEAMFFHDLEMRRILASDYGWKHAAPPLSHIASTEHAHFTLFILLAKHPVFWLQSLHRRPYRKIDRTVDFDRFVQSPFPLSEADGLTVSAVASPVDMLRMKIEGYMQLEALPVACVRMRYESLLTDFEQQLDRLSPFLLRRGETFVNHSQGIKNAGETLEHYRGKYDLAKAGEGVSPETLAFIRERLGQACLDFFDYDI